ncbi:MAG: TrmO family methyltransferase [Gemmatimonadales bacterium]|jgi:tRNA-Thr(GGU) m(6)t(6)A37 methyltransferase TsaA
MEVKHAPDVVAEPMEDVPGVTVRWLWAAADGAPNFALRLFEVEPGAASPHHSHAHEHEVYILSGQALVRGAGGSQPLAAGDTVLVLPFDEHQFVNTGPDVLRFLCGVPLSPESQAATAEPVTYSPIGRVENEFDEPASPETLRAAVSRVVIEPALADGLTGLEPGGNVMVVFYFHRSAGYELLQHPRGDAARPKRGVFALCSPHRPNPIGVTVAELLAVEGNVLEVRGLDAINGTPVLDLKPA